LLTTLALEPDLSTVRGLAIHLRISKPAVTRALDRLEEEGLAKRGPDPPTAAASCWPSCLPAAPSWMISKSACPSRRRRHEPCVASQSI
jgi:DNA-binding transcriptional MocR family regulator